MKSLFLLWACYLLWHSPFALANDALANDRYADLRNELLQMMALDQATIHKAPEQGFNQLRVKHATRMQAIVTEFGWPTIEMVGKEASQAAWLLVQHADHDQAFQQRMLSVMRPLALNGKINASNYAYLYDRTHQPQGYGTQGQCEGRDFKPFPIEDPAQLDQRRQEMGMPPAQSYWDLASNRMCGRK